MDYPEFYVLSRGVLKTMLCSVEFFVVILGRCGNCYEETVRGGYWLD